MRSMNMKFSQNKAIYVSIIELKLLNDRPNIDDRRAKNGKWSQFDALQWIVYGKVKPGATWRFPDATVSNQLQYVNTQFTYRQSFVVDERQFFLSILNFLHVIPDT